MVRLVVEEAPIFAKSEAIGARRIADYRTHFLLRNRLQVFPLFQWLRDTIDATIAHLPRRDMDTCTEFDLEDLTVWARSFLPHAAKWGATQMKDPAGAFQTRRGA